MMTELKPNILLLDDDHDVLTMLKLFLAVLNVNVSAFSNPEEALEYYASNHKDVDCFLCDLVMDPRNGLEVLKACREIKDTTPFYLMSANASSEDLTKAEELDVTGFIEKPMVHLQLEQVVASLHRAESRRSA